MAHPRPEELTRRTVPGAILADGLVVVSLIAGTVAALAIWGALEAIPAVAGPAAALTGIAIAFGLPVAASRIARRLTAHVRRAIETRRGRPPSTGGVAPAPADRPGR